MPQARDLQECADSTPEGLRESLIVSARENTAFRTRSLLVAARLCFVFSHGLLGISASAALASADPGAWWAVFTPAWIGNAITLLLCVASWFASCPYVQLCLAERQARFGDRNPSILTEILPDIVWAILGLIFVCLFFAGEVLLCGYLTAGRHGSPRHSMWPCACVFILIAALASCRGLLVKAGGESFIIFGMAVLGTAVAGLLQPGVGRRWVLLLPALVSAPSLAYVAVRELQECHRVLSREEKLFCRAEQAVLALLSTTLVVLTVYLAVSFDGGAAGARGADAPALVGGVAAGACVCSAGVLRARLAFAERRLSSVAERLLVLSASPLDPPSRYLPADEQWDEIAALQRWPGSFHEPPPAPPSLPSSAYEVEDLSDDGTLPDLPRPITVD